MSHTLILTTIGFESNREALLAKAIDVVVVDTPKWILSPIAVRDHIAGMPSSPNPFPCFEIYKLFLWMGMPVCIEGFSQLPDRISIHESQFWTQVTENSEHLLEKEYNVSLPDYEVQS
jgi:hypothetical protein